MSFSTPKVKKKTPVNLNNRFVVFKLCEISRNA